MGVCVCVFVFRQVSAHMHEYAPSSYVYWSSCDIPLLFCICLFVCLFVADTFTIVILFPADFSREARHFHFLPRRQHYMYWVWIHIQQRTGQCKCKHKPTNQNKRAQYGSFSQLAPLHLLCLPSLLAGVAIRSYNDRISFLPQEPSEAFLLWLEKYIFVGF